MLIDSHTHLDHSKEDVSFLLDDARRAGVGLIIQSGIELTSSRYSIELTGRFPEVFASVGFHPQEASVADEAGLAEIGALAAEPKVVAVGETGFDFFHDNAPHEVQEQVFVRHLDIARGVGLPVVIHTREAADDTFRVLAEHAGGLTVILHCFSLPKRLDEVLARGYYVSFAGNVTYKNAPDLQDAAKRVPPDRLLLETDAPWLTPVPLRGRPNRPGLVARVYDFVAGLRGVSPERLAEQVEANVRAAFPRWNDWFLGAS